MIQVYFTMSSIHSSDTLYVHDGMDTNAPLIGAYNNFTNPILNLLAIDATLANSSGCLTVRFVSGNSNEANGFNAVVSCETKCQEIISSLDLNLTSPSPDTNYIAICPGTEVNFSANATFPENNAMYPQSEASTSFEWVFGDGTTATGENVSHTYDGVGGYTVSLFATDDQGCVSSNSIDTRVVIAGNPYSNSNPPAPICANDTLIMDFDMLGIGGTIVEGDPYKHEISTTLGVTDTTYLPDGTGDCYETSVVFNCFDPGQTLDDPQDFLSLDINMEHTFIGDLEISIICPNAQELVLKSFTDDLGGTGYGGGTVMGEPEPSDDEIAGVGWDYSWTPITPTFGNMGAEAEASAGALAVGSYEPYGTFYDLVGCPLNGQWTIRVCDNWSADNGYIFSWEMTLNPDIAPDAWEYTVGIDSYSWAAGPHIIDQTSETITINPPSEGFYNYTYNITDHYGCVWDTTIVVEVLNSPNVNLGQDIVFCNDENTHVFNAQNPGDNYLWQDGSTSATYTAITSGMFWVSVTNGLCSSADTVQVFPHTGFTLNTTLTDVSCFEYEDGEANISATSMYPPYAYNWSNSTIGSHIDNLDIGNYYVTVIDNMGCEAFDTVSINQPTVLIASHSTTIISCFGGSDGTLLVSPSGGTAAYSYQWDNGGVTSDMSGLIARTYRVTITDDNACTLVYDVPISEKEIITTALGEDHFYCSEFEEQLFSSSTGGTAPYTYLWSTGSTNESIIISPTTDSQYTVTVTDSKNCELINSVNISIYPELVLFAEAENDTVCPDASTLIGLDISGGSGFPYTTYLNGELTTFPSLVTPANNEFFEIEIRDNCFHNAKHTITLFNHPKPQVSFTSDVVSGCPPLSIKMNNEILANHGEYYWRFTNEQDPSVSVVSTDVHPNILLEKPGVYNVDLQITNQFSCISDHLNNHYSILVFDKPLAKFSAEPFVTTIINSNISFANESENATEYLWDFGEGGQDDAESPFYKYNSIGEYQASLIAISAMQCSDTSEITIKIKEEFTFFIADAFTPDDDGKNETFKVYGNGIDNHEFSFHIFDRWGLAVFESTDISIGWNGRFMNTKGFVQSGQYQWICNYKDTNGISHEKTGVVNLIK